MVYRSVRSGFESCSATEETPGKDFFCLGPAYLAGWWFGMKRNGQKVLDTTPNEKWGRNVTNKSFKRPVPRDAIFESLIIIPLIPSISAFLTGNEVTVGGRQGILGVEVQWLENSRN